MAAVYFNQVSGIDFTWSESVVSVNSFFDINEKYRINCSDFYTNKLFAWYDLFCLLCDKDVCFNTNVQFSVDFMPKVKKQIEKIDSICKRSKALNIDEIPLDSAIGLFLENWKAIDSLKNNINYGKTSDYFNYVDERLSFLRIHTAFKALSIILQKQYRGVYNNALENAYLKFINVGFVNKYNLKGDIEILDSLKKRSFSNLDSINKIMNDSICIDPNKYK